ncbi:hypothetical protein TYRP_022488 [Tyrophagus putrescentiae]|nr:hypothetical protein TYRP_022488 [Tyrophagus putrescentiae]
MSCRSNNKTKGPRKKKYTDAMALLAEICKEGNASLAKPVNQQVVKTTAAIASSTSETELLSEQLTSLQLKTWGPPPTGNNRPSKERSVSAFGDDEISTTSSSSSSSTVTKSNSSESCVSTGSQASSKSSEGGEGGSYARINKDGAIIIKGADFEVLRDDSLYLRNKPLDFGQYKGPKANNSNNSNRRANTTYQQPRNVPDYSRHSPPIDWAAPNDQTEYDRNSTPLAQVIRDINEQFHSDRQKEKVESTLLPEYHRTPATVEETARFLEHHLYRCIFCEGEEGHTTVTCPATKAKKMNVLFDTKRCRACFDTDHPVKYCPLCGKKHLTYFEHGAAFKVSWKKVELGERWW